MQRIRYFTLLAIALLVGCSLVASIDHFDHQFICKGYDEHGIVVEGITYNYSGGYGTKNGERVYSLFVVFPSSGQHYVPVVRLTQEEIKGQIYSQEVERTIWQDKFGDERFIAGETKIADVSFDHVYFVNEGKVVFRKSVEELGIEFYDTVLRFNAKLRPILEKLIRENVSPQEHETEEEL